MSGGKATQPVNTTGPSTRSSNKLSLVFIVFRHQRCPSYQPNGKALASGIPIYPAGQRPASLRQLTSPITKTKATLRRCPGRNIQSATRRSDGFAAEKTQYISANSQ